MSGELTYRSLVLDRTAADAEARTVPASLSSEEPFERFGGAETLMHDPAAVDLTRAADGLPLLFGHDHDQPIGLVENVRLEGRRLVGLLRFGLSAKAQEVWRDVQAGILRNLSVGYRVIESETTSTGWRVTRWMPHEASVVSVPADATIGINRSFQGAPTMKQTQITQEQDIRDMARVANLDDDVTDDLLARNLSTEQARSAILEYLSERSGSSGITSRTQPAPADPATRTRAMSEALAWRFAGIAPSDAAHEFVGMRIVDMARDLLEARGHRTVRMSPSAIIERAMHATSDFSGLLLGAGERILRNGYLSYAAGIKRVSRETTARDFRAKQILMLGEMPALKKVNEGGEYTQGSAAESAASYALATYGRIFSISRQAMVNDDLGAFAEVAGKFGIAVAEYEAGHLVDLLTSNPNMSDSVALFHANHGNLAASGGAINVTTLGTAKKAMRLQKGLDGVTPINATPRFLIVPAELETVASQYLAQITPADSAKANPFANTLELVVDPRLDAKSATAWYLAADPATGGGLEHAYLEGQPGPYVEMRNGFEMDSMQIKCRLDFGAGFVDHRGWYKNPGA